MLDAHITSYSGKKRSYILLRQPVGLQFRGIRPLNTAILVYDGDLMLLAPLFTVISSQHAIV